MNAVRRSGGGKARTPTALAAGGTRTSGGVSPSGFVLLPTYMADAEYQRRRKLPASLSVIPAHPEPCVGCHGRCCTARVVLNVPDLVRLCVALGMHPSSVCDLSECESRNGEPILVGDVPRHMCLRKRDDEMCALTLTVDGQNRCGVHSIRPGICRLYPFSYARGATVYQMGHVVCPQQWVLTDERRDGFLDAVESHERDRVVDRGIVKAFNARPAGERSARAFWEHALREGAAALGMDASTLLPVPPRRKLGDVLSR